MNHNNVFFGQWAQRLLRSIFLVGALLLAAALLGALTGCGGGDPEDNPLPPDAPPAQTDGRKGNQPPECHLRPELCS